MHKKQYFSAENTESRTRGYVNNSRNLPTSRTLFDRHKDTEMRTVTDGQRRSHAKQASTHEHTSMQIKAINPTAATTYGGKGSWHLAWESRLTAAVCTESGLSCKQIPGKAP